MSLILYIYIHTYPLSFTFYILYIFGATGLCADWTAQAASGVYGIGYRYHHTCFGNGLDRPKRWVLKIFF